MKVKSLQRSDALVGMKIFFILLTLLSFSAFADSFSPTEQEQEIFNRVSQALGFPIHEVQIYRDWSTEDSKGLNWEKLGSPFCLSEMDSRFCVHALVYGQTIKIAHWSPETVEKFMETSVSVLLRPCYFSPKRLAKLYLHEALHLLPFNIHHRTIEESKIFQARMKEFFEVFIHQHGPWLEAQTEIFC